MRLTNDVLATRLLKRRVVDTTSGCWLWGGARQSDGYGSIWNGQTVALVHRVAAEIWLGGIPKGVSVCHKCDNPPCFNPEHLFTGTHLENHLDRARKRRIQHAKLTPDQVVAARLLRRQGMYIRDIATQFGVTYTPMHDLLHGKTYRWVL
jgi:hypothetical protein